MFIDSAAPMGALRQEGHVKLAVLLNSSAHDPPGGGQPPILLVTGLTHASHTHSDASEQIRIRTSL